MAVIICGRHGRQYGVFVSPYVASLMATSAKSEKKLLAVKLELMGEPGFFWCDEDFAALIPEDAAGVERTSEHLHVRDEDLAFDLFTKLLPVCVKCYDEYLAQHGLPRPEARFRGV